MSSQNAFVSLAAGSLTGEEESGRSNLPRSWGRGPSADARVGVRLRAVLVAVGQYLLSCLGFAQAAVDMETRNCTGSAFAD